MIKFNIQAKIRLTFAIVFSFMQLATIYLFIQINTISEQTRTLYEHPYQVSNAIREMKTEIFQNENLVRNIRLTDNYRRLDSLKAEIEKKDKLIQENFKIVSLQYLGNKASADSAFAIYTLWKNSCDKLYQLKKDNKTDSIQILIKNSIIVKFDSLVYSLNIISDFADNKAENTFNKVVKAEDNSKHISIILILVSGILTVFFTWYLSQSVIRPLKSFVSEANIILKKEEETKVIADEQLLLLTLSELKNAYLNIERQSREIELKNNQLSGINSELEDKVKLRTTELVMANKELAIHHESLQHLASIVESSEDAIVSKSLDGTIKSYNQAAEKMFGYTAEEAIGENILLIIPPEHTSNENMILDKIQNGEMTQHFETVRMKKNGEKFYVSLTVSPIKDSEGKITGISKIIRDITQRKKGEENFAASEMRYRRLFESAKDGILILDAETGMIVDVNPFMTQMLGYSHEEYLGKSIWDVGHFKDIVANKDNFLELQLKEYIRYDDLPLETSGGKIVHVEFVSNVYLVNNQKVIQCNIRDISERYRAEEAQKKWVSQFKKLSSNAPGMIYQFTRRADGSYYVPIASEGIREIYGCSPEDVIDDFSPIVKLIYSDDVERMIAEIEYSAKNLTFFNIEYRVQIRDKAMKWLHCVSSPEKMEDGNITWYGFITDITDLKQAEDTLLKLSEQLENIGEMAKIGGWELDIATTQVTYSRETARIHEVDFPYVPPKLSQGNEYYPPDVWPDVQAAVQAAIENGTAYDREWPLITAKGKHIWVRAQGFAVRENGKTIKLRGTFQDITKRKQAEAELLESENRYRTLFNHMQEGFALHEIICDTNGKPVDYRFLDINPSFEQLTGLKKSEIIGKTVLTVIPGTESFWIEKYGEVAFNGNPMAFENYSAPLKRHYQINAFRPAKNQFATIFSDITERKLAEIKLHESEEKFSNAFKTSHYAITITNPKDGKFIEVNDAFTTITGYTQDESLADSSVGMNLWVNEKDRNQVVNELFEGREVAGKEFFFRKKDGELITGLFSAHIIKVNKEPYILSSINDITDRKNAERALLESAKKFSDTVKYLDEGYYSVTMDGILLDHNFAFNRILGIDISRDMKGVRSPDFWQNPKERDEYLKELMTNGVIKNYEVNVKTNSSEKNTVLLNSHLIKDEEGKMIRIEGTVIDITELKLIEQKLIITLENLERSNKDLEQFAYVANHDLQEPLRMISSYTQLLERKYKDKLDQDARDYIHFAVDGAIRLQKLLNALLEYSRVSTRAKTFEQVDISKALGQVISNLQLLIATNRAIITNDDLPVVKSDEYQILSIFQNLIENAIKFKKKTELPKIHISCTKRDNIYQFSVADNGIGIEKQYHDRIFIVFQRLHSVKDYPGTGIGLSICKRIAERHGGTIWFESTVNEGTTFYFTIPV